MTDTRQAQNLNREEQAARQAVEHGKNIREATRNIALAALSQRRLDTEGVKAVVRSVMQGASMGIDQAGDKSRLALSEALGGIDEALAKSAEATKLAIEEASGRLKTYGKLDLERAYNDLLVLEEMMLETVKDVAEHSTGTAKDIIDGLLQHTRIGGTQAGLAAREAIAALEKNLGRTLREVAAAGTDVALNTGSDIAEAAAGFLSGIAETLHGKADSLRNQRK